MTYPYVRHRDADARLTTRLIIPAIQSVACDVWLNGGDSLVSLTRRNLADRSLLDVVGTPTTSAGLARTTANANYFQSLIMERSTFTYFVFGRRSDTSADAAHTGVFGGNFVGASDSAALLYWASSTTLRGQAAQGTNTAKTSILTVASGANTFKRYRFVVQRSGISGSVQVFNDTDSTSATAGTFDAAADLGTLPWAFGSARSASWSGHCEWNHQSLFAGVPTADEITAHWNQVLGIASDMGVAENT